MDTLSVYSLSHGGWSCDQNRTFRLSGWLPSPPLSSSLFLSLFLILFSYLLFFIPSPSMYIFLSPLTFSVLPFFYSTSFLHLPLPLSSLYSLFFPFRCFFSSSLSIPFFFSCFSFLPPSIPLSLSFLPLHTLDKARRCIQPFKTLLFFTVCVCVTEGVFYRVYVIIPLYSLLSYLSD